MRLFAGDTSERRGNRMLIPMILNTTQGKEGK